MPGSYIFLFCPASIGRILSEMKGDRRHLEREIQMFMVYLTGLSKIEFPASQWRRTNADASYQTWIFTYLSNTAIYLSYCVIK